MPEEFIVFQSFPAIEIAEEFANHLETTGIPHQLVRNHQAIDPILVGNYYSPEFSVLLKSGDFSRAHKALEHYFSPLLSDVPTDYYLYDFSNQELYEIIRKPDEWGYFDYALARKLLNDRGEFITDTQADLLREERTAVLKKPKASDYSFFFLVYGLLLANLVATYNMTRGGTGGFVAHPAWPFACMFYAVLVWHGKKTAPDGERVFIYDKRMRSHAAIAFFIGLAILATDLIILFTN